MMAHRVCFQLRVNPWMSVFVLLVWSSSHNVAGQHQVIGPSEDILVKVGDEVVLPCHVEPPVIMDRKTVEWARHDLKPWLIYLLQDGHFYPEYQDFNPLYKDRVFLFPERLKSGNMSLKLSRVRLSDQGNYSCYAPHLRKGTMIKVLVGSVSRPVISSDGPTLSCDSGCWFPQPELTWLDADGNNISAGPSVNHSSKDCYSVQSSVTMTTPGQVTCRVHLSHINHTEETRHDVTESDFPSGSSGAVIGWIIAAAIILAAAAAGYVFYHKKKHGVWIWKKKKNSGQNQSHGDDVDAMEELTPKPLTPHPWTPTSQRWRKQFEKLKDNDCDVIKVGRLVLGTNDEFRIGEGNNGIEVFLGLTADGTEVAVKRMRKLVYKNYEGFSDLLELKDPSVVQYVDHAQDGSSGYVALRLCEFNLDEFMHEHRPSEAERKHLAQQVLQSLKVLHCHDPPILHRDIKPQNVLIGTDGKARLSDFGIIVPQENPTTGTTTLCWMAREMVEEEDRADKEGPGAVKMDTYEITTDIQVAGMLLYYILSEGQHPFGSTQRECKQNIMDGSYDLDHIQGKLLATELIEKMINKDPGNRPTVEECLEDPFWSLESDSH